jgi:hypothetical protein
MAEMSNHHRVTVSVVGCESANDMAAVAPEAHSITLKRPFIDLFYDLKAADAAGCEEVVVPIPADMPDMDSDSITGIGICVHMFVDSKPTSVRSIVFVVAGNPVAFQPILDEC